MFGERQPFSTGWVMASVVIFTAMEIVIAMLIAPAIFAGRLASPMLQMRLEMLMHLASFYVGGVFVGLISPRVRLLEPAVGAFVSVVIVFMFHFFMPMYFRNVSTTNAIIGGAIAFVLAITGAYTGEKWMGNVEATKPESARAKLRDRMWGDHGLLSRGDARFTHHE